MKLEITFPVYRKYKNEKSFFKIISKTEFEEIKLFKDNGTLQHFEAKILPDHNFIYDMINNYSEHWALSDEKEYESIKSKI